MPPDKQTYINRIKKSSGNPSLIDGNLCRACGGRCCDASGCGLMPCDVPDMSINGVRKLLNTGKYSITFFYLDHGFGILPLPVLASREIGAGKVNHSIIRRRCALKGDNGCPLSEKERPTQALLYIPKPEGKCCSLLNSDDIYQEWVPYAPILEYIVRVETGKTSKELFDQGCAEAAEQIQKKIRAANGHILRANLTQGEIRSLYLLEKTDYIFDIFLESV